MTILTLLYNTLLYLLVFPFVIPTFYIVLYFIVFNVTMLCHTYMYIWMNEIVNGYS